MADYSFGVKRKYSEVTLEPFPSQALQDERPTVVESTESPRHKILLVDDDHYFLEFIGAALNERFDVVTADNGSTALDLFKDEKPNLIITDICMPKMSGFELIRELRKYPSTPIIAVSGYEITQHNYDASSLIEDTVVKVIRKPCSVLEIFQAAELYVAKTDW